MFLLNRKITPTVFVHHRVPSKQLHYWGSGSLIGYPLEKLFGCGSLKKEHQISWETLRFKALTWISLSKVNGPALHKERWIKGFVFFCFYDPKSFCAQYCAILGIWVTHGVPHWKIVWVLFFNHGLVRHLIIWITLHLQGFNMDMAFSSEWTSFTQRKVDKRFCVFFPPRKFLRTIGCHPSNDFTLLRVWVTHGVPPWKIVWVLFFTKGLIRNLIISGTLHFQGFNMDMAFKSKWTSFTQRHAYTGG